MNELLVATNPDLDSRLGYLPRRVAAPPNYAQSLIVTRKGSLGWRAWLAERGTPLLAAGRVHVDLWVPGTAGRWRWGCVGTAAAVGDRLVLPLPARPRAIYRNIRIRIRTVDGTAADVA